MLNQICSNTYLPKKNMSELEKGETYLVTEIKQVSTKYGLKAVVVIAEEFQVFLTNRVSKTIEENGNLFDQLAEKANNTNYLYYTMVNKILNFVWIKLVNKCK